MTTITLCRFDRQRVEPDLPREEDTESGYSKEIMTSSTPPKRTPVEEVLERAWGRLTACGLAL